MNHFEDWQQTEKQYNRRKQLSQGLTYNLVIEKIGNGYVEPSPKLIASLFPKIIFEQHPIEHWSYLYKPYNLTKHPYTLEKHFWYIFEEESKIYNSHRLVEITGTQIHPKKLWFHAIKKYVVAGKINKKQLLVACLKATSRDFDKFQRNWFIRLFDFLNPTQKELLELQGILIDTLKGNSPTVVKSVLKHLAQIIPDNQFDTTSFLKQIPRLLERTSNTIISSVLSALSKLLKRCDIQAIKIINLVLSLFNSPNEAIQNKAALFLEKQQAYLPDKFEQQLLTYFPNICINAREILRPFCKSISSSPITLPKFIPPTNHSFYTATIAAVTSFEEFLSFSLGYFNQVTDEGYSILLDGLMRFQHEVKGKNIRRLSPLFRKSYKIVFEELSPKLGMIDNMVAALLIDFSTILINRFPKDTNSLKKIASKYVENKIGLPVDEKSNLSQSSQLQNWHNPYDPSKVYETIKQLFTDCLIFIAQGVSVPLLSLPTHSANWIDPIVIVERLVIYQKLRRMPSTMDLQIAISKIKPTNEQQVLQLAYEKLQDKYLRIFHFLFIKKQPPPSLFINEAKEFEIIHSNSPKIKISRPLLPVWETAIITKYTLSNTSLCTSSNSLKIPIHIFLAQYKWSVFWEIRQNLEYNHKTQRIEYMGDSYLHSEIQIKFRKYDSAKPNKHFLYHFLLGQRAAFRPNSNDIERILGLAPNNPEPLLTLLIEDNLRFSEFWEEDAPIRIQNALSWLLKNWNRPYGDMAHLFLAASMVWKDLKCRRLAGEIWKKGVQQDNLNNKLLGEMLGKLISSTYAPLKKFTDLVKHQLINLSQQHNEVLELLIIHLINKLPAVPPRNAKKLLEIYRELLIQNQSIIALKRVKILFALWQEVPHLKEVIQSLRPFAQS